MSRRDFRASVDQPRPASAWIMSLVASASLWLTEQIPAWLIAVQCSGFLLSFVARKNPPAILKSPIWLNVLMAGITTVTIRSALAGNPATISLAYFTALSQGLQLLDARPRKSEFVLVALALFQIILASNLTDSVFFSPLVLVFLATVTWTLLIHTISIEATESGESTAASATLAPDLRRMTIRATVACLVLAVAIFVLFPRPKTNLLRGGPGAGIALSGFSDRVRLGDVGKIRLDHSVVLRVEPVEGRLPASADAYWRGLAFDEFDGTTWSISQAERVAHRRPISGIGRFGIVLRPEQSRDNVVQRIIREPVAAGVLFVPGDVQRIEGSFQNLERDRNGAFFLPARGDERIRYTVRARASERNVEQLRLDRARPPLEVRPGGERPAARYLRLPELDSAVLARTEEIVASASNDFDRAAAIQQSLRRNGRYTDAPPPLGNADTSPIEAFILGELEGHCEYFASAMVAMARTQGLPSRLVNGFAGGVRNDVGGFVEVTQADAHAWVEIHFEQAGWVRFDPTPPDRRLRAETAGSLWNRLAQLGGAMELWWFQRVVDFDSVDQIGALRGVWLSWRARRTGTENESPLSVASSDRLGLGAIDVTAVQLVLGLGAGLAIAIAIWRRRRRDDASLIPAPYRAALRVLARGGFQRRAAQSARDFAVSLDQKLSPEGVHAFATLTEDYLACRFGDRRASPADSHLAVLEDAVDRMRLRNQSHIR